MNSLIALSTVLALFLYFPLCIQIIKGKVQQNFATWFLWATLDGVAAGTLVVQHGNYLLPVAYTLGSGITALCIIRSKNFVWTWFESLVTILVIICITIWAVSGPRIATIASSLAMIIAGAPQIIETYQRPRDTPIMIFFGYFTANSLSMLGAKSWTVEERFYPTCAATFCLAIVIIILCRRGKYN